MDKIQKISNWPEFTIGDEVSVHGRVSRVRKMKTCLFADLMNKNARIQLRFSNLASLSLPCVGDLVRIKGRCFLTNTKEPSIDVLEIEIENTWKNRHRYTTIHSKSRSSPLKAFIPGAYEKCRVPYLIRNHIRDYFRSKDFLEVQTPILCKQYNGGRSYVVTTGYIGGIIGFNRGTMEERMQALVGLGFERIFQIGNVFRSSEELTFVEGYAAYMDWQSGQSMIRDMCHHVAIKMVADGYLSDEQVVSHLINNEWSTINFFDAAIIHFGTEIEDLLHDGTGLTEFLKHRKIIDSSEMYLESAADSIGTILAADYTLPVLINNFPEWSSPLYAHDEADIKYRSLKRSRVYLPGDTGGFDIGIQELNYENFITRVRVQRNLWNLEPNDPRRNASELEEVLSAGMPPMFGFGLNPDRLSRIWNKDASIDPFR